ncbi:MAG: PAS domain S-box-containing protein [Roseivirga sp.]
MKNLPQITINQDAILVNTFRIPRKWFDELRLKINEPIPKDLAQKIIGELPVLTPFNFNCDILGLIFKLSVEPSEDLYHVSFELSNKKPYVIRKRSINRYQMLVETANDIIYETDLTGRFIYVNPKAVEITGFSREELLSKSLRELILKEHRDIVIGFYSNQLSQSISSTYKEFPVLCANNEILWIGQNVQILEDEGGMLGMMAVARDVTERRDSDSVIRFSEKKYRGMIENLQFGLLEVSMEEKITFVNDAMCAITGYRPDELIGEIASDILISFEQREILDNQHMKRSDGVASVYEVNLKHKDGSDLWVLISAAPNYDINGDCIGSLGIHLDITDKKRDEEELLYTRSRLDKYMQGLQLLNEITANPDMTGIEQIKQGLKIAANYLGLPIGIMSEVNGKDYIIKEYYVEEDNHMLYVGQKFEFEKTYCNITYKANSKIAVSHFSQSEFAGHPAFEVLNLESYIATSYYVKGERRGTVNFSSPNPRPIEFDSYDLEFIDLFAKFIGFIKASSEHEEELATERKNLTARNEKLSGNQRYLSAINGFVTKLLTNEDMGEIAWEIAENVIDEFGFEDCVIYILNEEEQCLDQLAAYGPKIAKNRIIINPIKIQFGEGMVGSVAQSGVAEIIADTSKDKRYVVDDAIRLSEITVPIIADGRVIGVIDCEHSDKNFFNNEHLATLTTIANLASNRLKNAKAKLQQLRAESELRDNETKLRTIINSALDAIITINKEGKITEWNPQAEQIFGWTLDEVLGKYLTENIIPSQHKSLHTKGIGNYLSTGKGPVLNQRIEITAMNKAGKEFPIELAILPIIRNGVHSFTAFARDITLQKEVQAEMEKALSRERELSELKSRFVSMTSHEFRTPLTTIKQNVDLVSFKLENQLPQHFEEYNKYLKRIDSEVNRVTLLMNDILTLGKLESGRVEIIKEHSDLVEIVSSSIKQQTQLRADGRTVDLMVSGVPQPVAIDLQFFNHILSNLVSNALKYSEGTGNPVITLNFRKLKKVVISVKDHGIGIPLKDQKGLFASFYRATNVQNIQGTGLGLSIVKQFVEMHGGTIHLKSEKNQGSEFIVDLPYV